MRRSATMKTARMVLGVFLFATLLVPALSSGVMAADTPDKAPARASAPVKQTSSADPVTGIFTEETASDAAVEGAAAGTATWAGFSAGTIAIGAMIVASGVAVAISAASDSGSSTSHH